MLPYIILLVDIFLNMPRSMSLVLLLIVPVLTYVIILFSPVLFISFKIVNPNLLIHIRILYKCVINRHNFQYHATLYCYFECFHSYMSSLSVSSRSISNSSVSSSWLLPLGVNKSIRVSRLSISSLSNTSNKLHLSVFVSQ